MGSAFLEKVRRFNESRPKYTNRGRTTGIFHNWKDGENPMRFVQNFVETKTHFVAPSKRTKLQTGGLCIEDAFEGEESIPKVVNCADWDMENEEWREEKTCVICKLNRLAKKVLEHRDELDAETREKFEAVTAATYARTALKWNCINRDDPNVIKIDDDGNEEKVLGLKIANVGIEAWEDISGIIDNLGLDITDPDEGIDIIVVKQKGARVSYSAKPVFKGMTVKQTPLTEEERALEPHDILKLCGVQTDQDRVLDGLHEEYREMLSQFADDISTTPKKKSSPAPKKAAATEELADMKADEPETDEPETEEPETEETEAEEPEPEAKAEETEAKEPEPEPEPEPEAEETKDEPEAKAEETKAEEPEAEEAEAEKSDDSGDAGEEVDPTSWECYGTFEGKHPECQQCVSKAACESETLRKSSPKKGKKA